MIIDDVAYNFLVFHRTILTDIYTAVSELNK